MTIADTRLSIVPVIREIFFGCCVNPGRRADPVEGEPVPLSSIVSRRVLHAGMFAAIVAVMAVTPSVSVDAKKGKPIPNPTANLTFADASGHAVTSDTAGTYFNGVDGVEATVFTSPSYSSSGDLVVQFGRTRHINISLSNPMALTDPPAAGPGPVGVYAAGGLFVQAIGFVTVGATEPRVARIGNFAALQNHAIGFRANTNTDTFVNGTPVCVHRYSATGWTIFTTATGECAGGGQVGALFSESVKKGKTVHTFVARYVLPFSLDVQLQ